MSNRDVLEGQSIAVVHGNYLARGGGEVVAEAIARTFDGPLYYGFGYDKYEPDDIETHSLFNDAFMGSVIKRIYQMRDLYYMKAFRYVPELHDYDILIQSGNEMGWYVPPEDQVIVKYTHSTPRNIYDRYPVRAGEGSWLSRAIYGLYTFVARQLYETVLSYPDMYVANSEVIERRIDKYWGKSDPEVRVVYPPVETENYGQQHAADAPIDERYYLALDRIESSKHIDRIADAFTELPHTLVVAGDGSMREDLEKEYAGFDRIEFLGYVSENDKRALLASAEALVYAAEGEDFGIVPIEAFASGTPVIGPDEGFTHYQVEEGVNGYLYDSTAETLRRTVERFETDGVEAPPHAIEEFAEQFDTASFREGMQNAVEVAIERNRIETSLKPPTEFVEQEVSHD
ncbi:MAG: glycosyltransferase [Halorhabdus sp.]